MTPTGRTPKEPNLQNTPIHTEEGKKIRQAFLGHTKIGFTGTSKGIPEAQLLAAMKLLIKGAELHFGDCVGADAQAWYLATAWGFRTVAHPPIDPKKRAFCKADEIREPKPYIERNHDIVDECERLIATPRTMEEELRSGTWATIRYARKLKKPVIIVTPNGTLYGALYG